MQGEGAGAPPSKAAEIGVILVHGIGEQRRFEHLDEQLRFLIRALHGLKLDPNDPVSDVTVDIRPAGAAAFHAEADTWNAGPEPTVTIAVHCGQAPNQTVTRLNVHEVWWADVNETYSLAKQLRFWLWGLSVWCRAPKEKTAFAKKAGDLPDSVREKTDAMMPAWQWHLRLWDQFRLYAVGVYFVLLGYSIGTLSFLGNRLLNLKTPKLLQLITNYVSGVKIYNQRHRYGPGWSWQWEEFLDSVGEPPRVSIRRRMIRAIADVACNGYDRWYILAHSLGAVVAFNGIMETAYAWPGYLEESHWLRLRAQGLSTRLAVLPSPLATLPRRPAWLTPDVIVNRPAIFAKFVGLLTYGAPLEKFASIWPALVTMSKEPGVFANTVNWINAYDPLDPVSGRLTAFAPSENAGRVPPVQNLGYNAGWVLLLAHTQYLKRRQDGKDLATAVSRWLLTNNTAPFNEIPHGSTRLGDRFSALGTEKKEANHWIRSAVAWAWWLVTAVILLVLGEAVLPTLLSAAGTALGGIGRIWNRLWHLGTHDQLPTWLQCLLKPIADFLDCCTTSENFLQKWILWLIDHLGISNPLVARLALLAALALVLPGIVGIAARLFFFHRDDDDETTRPKDLNNPDVRRRQHGI